VSILTADLSHLRARLVPGTKEEVLQRQSLLSEDFARKIAQTQAESSATYRRKPRLYAPVSGPEFLAHIATIPKTEWRPETPSVGGYFSSFLTPSLWLRSSSSSSPSYTSSSPSSSASSSSQSSSTSDSNDWCLVVFNPKDVEDAFVEVTWRNIVDLYVQRVFPGPSFANLRRKIENHRDGVIQLDHGHGDDDYGAGGGVSEQRIVWQTRNMQPINVEDYIRAEGHSDPAPTASSSSSPSPSLETTTRLLASYMGLLDQENARWHHAFRRAASGEGPRTGVRNAKTDDSSEPEVSSLRSVDYERMYFVSDEAIQRLDNVEVISLS